MLTFPTWLFADPDAVSLEAADRPNFFLHVTANGSLELAKWQGSDAFHLRASFLLHRGTWRAGLVALESLAEPGSFLYVSGSAVALRPHEHVEAFRRGTLFRLVGRCLPLPLPLPSALHSVAFLSSSLHHSNCPSESILTFLAQGGPTGVPPEMRGGPASMLVA